MAGHHHVPGHHADACGIETGADPLAREFTGHRIAIALHADQAGARDLGFPLHVAVKWGRHGHHLRALLLEHLKHAEVLVFGVADLTPQGAAALAQPGVELIKGMPLARLRLNPDSPAAVLDVLLHDTLLPATGDVAEVGIKQVVRAHDGKAGIDDAALALFDLVHGGLHVVVDATPGNATQGREGACVGIKQHLVTLAGVGHQPEGTAGAQLHVGHLDTPVNATDHQAFFAPVELERLAQIEFQGYEGVGLLALGNPPFPDEVSHATVATQVAAALDLGKQCFACALVLFVAVGIGFEGLLQLLCEGRQLAKPLGPNVPWSLNFLRDF